METGRRAAGQAEGALDELPQLGPELNVPPLAVAPMAQLANDRLSDAGGPRFESQTGRVRDEFITSLRRDRRPAIKGLRPPEQHTGNSIRTEKTPSSQKNS